MTRRNTLLLVAVAAVAAVGAYWMLVLAPKREEAAGLDKQIAAKQAVLAQSEAEVADYEQARTHLQGQLLDGRAARQGRAGRRRRALAVGPAQRRRRQDQGRLPHDQPQLAGRAGRRPRCRADHRSDAAPGRVDGRHRRLLDDALLVRFKGSFFELGKFFNRLDRFVAVRNGGLDVTGRLLLLNSITLTPDTVKGFPMLTADVTANAYLLPATEGLTAGATADGPDRDAAAGGTAPFGAQRPGHDDHRDHLWSHPMSVLNDTWRFLVQRRLWPVAILLIAAAAAVPMLLSQAAGARRRPSPTVAVKADKEAVLAADPIVAQAADGDRAGRRRCSARARTRSSRRRRRPRPRRPQRRVQADRRHGADRRGSAASPVRGRLARAGHQHPGGPRHDAGEEEATSSTSCPCASARRARTSSAATSSACRLCRRAGHPVLIYLGVLDDKKTAVFMLDSGVVAQGDGTCKPSRTTCETIHIREGETEFFDVTGEKGETASQYQLDVIKIRKKTTTDAKQAKAAKARVSKKGKQILRARIAGDGPLRYRYDKKSGRLEKLSKKAYKAVVAKAAKAARAHF